MAAAESDTLGCQHGTIGSFVLTEVDNHKLIAGINLFQTSHEWLLALFGTSRQWRFAIDDGAQEPGNFKPRTQQNF